MSTFLDAVENTVKGVADKREKKISTEAQALLDLIKVNAPAKSANAAAKGVDGNPSVQPDSAHLNFGSVSELYNDHLVPAVGATARANPTGDSQGTGLNGISGLAKDGAAASPGAPPQITAAEVQAGGMSIDPKTGRYVPDGGATGVEQAGWGDCWFEASVAALASTPKGAQLIANSIKSNSDGSYTVTFAGDKNNPVNVTQQDLSNSKIADSAQWARVVEAALVKKDPSGATNGGYSQDAFKLLTGQNATDESVHSSGSWWNPFNNGHDSLVDTQNALNNGDAVTASTKGMSNPYAGPVVWDHEYQVVAANSNTQTVTLRNPWGENQAGAGPGLPGVGQTKDGVTDIGGGEIQVSYSTFRKDFDTVDYTPA